MDWNSVCGFGEYDNCLATKAYTMKSGSAVNAGPLPNVTAGRVVHIGGLHLEQKSGQQCLHVVSDVSHSRKESSCRFVYVYVYIYIYIYIYNIYIIICGWKRANA